MIFAVAPGSAGCGEERYISTLPFQLSPGVILRLPDESMQFAGATGGLRIERLRHQYVASLGPYPSKDAAQIGLADLRAAVLWCAIEFGVGVRYSADTGAVTIFDEPIAIPDVEPMAHIGKITKWKSTEGCYEAGVALVRPDHKRLVRLEVGRATVTSDIAVEHFIEKAEEALAFENLSGVAASDKLKLAIEVAMSHRFEASENAEFITLITSLEALLPEIHVSFTASAAIAEAEKVVRDKRNAFSRADPEWQELERLLGRVSKLKEDSIGEALRSFVDATLTRHPELGDRTAISKQVRNAYEARSRLLHNGHHPHGQLSASLNFLRNFVPRVLRCLFKEATTS